MNLRMHLALDSTAYLLFDRGFPPAVRAMDSANRLFLPVIIYGELTQKLKEGKPRWQNYYRLEKFIDTFGIEIIDIDKNVGICYADLLADLEEANVQVDNHLLWVSACCCHLKIPLLTANREFLKIRQMSTQLLSYPP